MSNSLAGFSLEDIITERTIKPPKILIYGEPGIGKTTFACGARAPILIPTEDGLATIAVPHFPMVAAYDQFIDAVKLLLKGGHEFKTVVLDSVDNLEPLVWEEFRVRTGKPFGEHGYGKDAVLAKSIWEEVRQALDALRERGMTVIVIGHADITRFEDPEHGPYDTFDLRLHKKARPVFIDWADAVLFANYRVHITEEEGAFGKKDRRAIGAGERALFTTRRPAWRAKNRYGLPDELPLRWEAFKKAFDKSMGLEQPAQKTNEATETTPQPQTAEA